MVVVEKLFAFLQSNVKLRFCRHCLINFGDMFRVTLNNLELLLIALLDHTTAKLTEHNLNTVVLSPLFLSIVIPSFTVYSCNLCILPHPIFFLSFALPFSFVCLSFLNFTSFFLRSCFTTLRTLLSQPLIYSWVGHSIFETLRVVGNFQNLMPTSAFLCLILDGPILLVKVCLKLDIRWQCWRIRGVSE